ncbi:MAG TPA: SDR family NAD(P)-dependent oxidoreductase [Candidatus Limnocylindrales bacterium]
MPPVDGSVGAARVLEDIAALSRRFGADPEFSRAGGGNSSAKVNGVLHIKPSGAALADLRADALMALDMRPLLALLEGESRADGSDEVMRVSRAARLDPDDDRFPSVEALFHAVLPETFVLHTHPIVVNTLTCSVNGATLAERWFGDRVEWIPYTDPGLPLAHSIRERRAVHVARAAGRRPDAFLLQNHGLIVAADTISEVARISEWVVATIRSANAAPRESSAARSMRAGATPIGEVGISTRPATRMPSNELADRIAPALRALLASGPRLKVVTLDDSPFPLELASTASGRALVGEGPLTPDQIVYAGSWAALLDSPPAESSAIVPWLRGALTAHRARCGNPPTIVVVEGLGAFAVGDSWRQADTARHIFLDSMRVAAGARELGGVRGLAPAERQFIERWEAEEYRRRVSAGATAAGRAAGLVAIVTGAAQGFGLAIAQDLVAEGAHVVLADMNVELARARAGELAERFGPGSAMAAALDVTDEASVAACFRTAVRTYGGVDLVVSNAGILRAGAVTTQPVAEFDAVTRVNYRGYYLCVRNAAPILARQHEAKPDYWGDIVEINSKSGLAGSSRNSAYAGSKFGGIGLTQSFALELVEDGIKVNAICPGNFLDGPLWSDPDSGLFVQYLREGKVPGATTVDDVRRFYEAKVPMGRGCTPRDVLEALYYVVAQKYETGQAVPVTGGQVMLS